MSSLTTRPPLKRLNLNSSTLDTVAKKPKKHKVILHAQTTGSTIKYVERLHKHSAENIKSDGYLRPNERGSIQEKQMSISKSHKHYRPTPIIHRTSLMLSQLSWCASQSLKLVTAIVVLTACRYDSIEVYGQRAPCYECEVYRESHPHSNPYEQVRARCVYPCECQRPPSSCPPGETLVQDACGCCWQCEAIPTRIDQDMSGRKTLLSNRDTFLERRVSQASQDSDSQFKLYDSLTVEDGDSQSKTVPSQSAETHLQSVKSSEKGSPTSDIDSSQFHVVPALAAVGAVCGPHRACVPGSVCRYSVPGTIGTCREEEFKPCLVNGTSYEDGQTFHPDCRTECTCRSSTYACSSLCPGEALPPSSHCKNPRLSGDAAGTCCRQWTCDPDPDVLEPSKDCDVSVSRWSICSSVSCGLGLSQRWATDRQTCRPALQTRLCQLRPCTPLPVQTPVRQIRRGRHCKATIRSDHSHHLVAGPCVSQRRYRPKQCNACVGSCCSAFLDTSLQVSFMCPLHGVPPYLLSDQALSAAEQAELFDTATEAESQKSKLGDLTVEGEEMFLNVTASNYEVVHKQVQWIVRCRCTPTCRAPTARPTEIGSEFSAESVVVGEMEFGAT